MSDATQPPFPNAPLTGEAGAAPSGTPLQQDAATGYPSVPTTPPPQDQRTPGMLCHLLALAGLIGIPLANILGPLIMWLVKKDTMAFVDDQGKESLNFQILVTIALLLSIPLWFVCIGVIVTPVIAIGALVFIIIASIKASRGEYYRYPVNLRLIK